MFEKNLNIVFLLDFYGDVLDEHTKNILNLYYDEDLSLAEIAEEANISRQGVRHVIKKGEEQLTFLENRLGLAKEFGKISGIIEKMHMLSDEVASLPCEDAKIISQKLKDCIEKIRKQ